MGWDQGKIKRSVKKRMKNKEVLEKILLAMYAQEKIEKINEYIESVQGKMVSKKKIKEIIEREEENDWLYIHSWNKDK